jgi:hypothetical protein
MYPVVLPLANGVSSLTALASAGSTLALAGIVLKCWNGWEEGRPGTVLLWIAMSTLLPWPGPAGLSQPVCAMLTVFSFAASFYRPRGRSSSPDPPRLSRPVGIRNLNARSTRHPRVVWANDDEQPARPWNDRAEAGGLTYNAEHLDRVKRLNQDSSAPAWRISSVRTVRPRQTLWAAVAVIRARCGQQAVVGGGGDLVSRFAG